MRHPTIYKFRWHQILTIAAVTTSCNLWAADDSKSELNTLKIGVLDAKLGLDYRAEYEHHDHGLLKNDNNTPTATSAFALKVAKLKLSGKLDPDVDFKLQFNMVKTSRDTEAVEIAMFNYWLSDRIAFGFGKEKVRQGGFEMKQSAHDTLIFSPYKEAFAPFGEYQASASLMAKVAGILTLQLTEDVTKKKYSTAAVENKTARSEGQQPATILEWMGDFDGISPLLQVGAYDLGKSHYSNLGFKYAGNGIDASIDYMYDQRARYVADTKFTDNYTTVALSASYLMNNVRPFLKYTRFDVKQSDSDGSKNLSGNTTMVDNSKSSDSDGSKNFDDNAQAWTVGTFLAEHKRLYRPYVAYVSRSGKFLKSTTNDDTEVRIENMLKIGISGDF